MNQTALHDLHIQSGGKMVDFAGYAMPLHYGSQIDEHHAVRQHAGMFDVSHMVVIDFSGSGQKAFLQFLLANDVAKLEPQKALYTCMLNDTGGVVDDLIVYQLEESGYRLVVNAGTREKDIAWIQSHAVNFEVDINVRDDFSILAVQGPKACSLVAPVLPFGLGEKALELKPFRLLFQNDWMVARTGYTGEDGFEIVLPNDQIKQLWLACLDLGVQPCGLGARDTLRLEAGMNLYGQDMTDETSPLTSGLAWTVAMKDDRNFVGRQALEAEKQKGVSQKRVGLVLEAKGVLRLHQKVVSEDGAILGKTTSGSFSPSLQKSIALARVDKEIGDSVFVEIRNKRLPVSVIRPPFL